MSKATIIFGWMGNNIIYDLLAKHYDEKEQKHLNQLLKFHMNNKGIHINYGFNRYHIKSYETAKEKGSNPNLVKGFEQKYSVFYKMKVLKGYIDRLKYKFGISLKVSFVRHNKGIDYVLYFRPSYTANAKNEREHIPLKDINSKINQWDRIKHFFNKEPEFILL